MANKIPASEIIGKEIDEVFQRVVSGKLDGGGLYELLMQKAKLLIAQEALEKEVKEFLERDYYKRDKTKSQLKGYRNDYEPKKLRRAEGNLILQIPQVRNSQEPFNSKFKQFFKNNPPVGKA